MLKVFIFLVASWAGGWFVLVEPGLVGGQVALPGAHLVDPPRNKFSLSHEGVWGEVRGVGVVGVCGVFSHPFLKE